MKRTHLLAVLISFATVAVLGTDAFAVYHPTLGRFLQRDPEPGGPIRIGAGRAAPIGGFVPRDPTEQYADGMNLYQYARSNSLRYVDFSGFQASQPGSQPASGSTSRPAAQPEPSSNPAVPDWSLANVARGIVVTTKKAGHPRPVECIFSYSKRTVCCTDGQYAYCCEAVSGQGEHMNNPASQGVKDKGPVPVGEYWAEKSRIHPKSNIYWHNLRKKVGGRYAGYTNAVDPGGRSAFGFHPGTFSMGCVTVLNNDTNGRMANPYGNQCFKNISFLIGQSKYCDTDDDGGARLFVQN